MYILKIILYYSLYIKYHSIQCLITFSRAGQSCPVNGQLRLVQTASINLPNSGRVEICMGGVWGTIAADSVAIPWSEKNVQVACIELGFSGALNSVFQGTYVM